MNSNTKHILTIAAGVVMFGVGIGSLIGITSRNHERYRDHERQCLIARGVYDTNRDLCYAVDSIIPWKVTK